MFTRILKHLHKHNILRKSQFSFQKGLSTEQAIYTFINKVFQFVNDKMVIIGLFCDLSKAFDTVNHQILSQKANILGVSGVANDRKQTVVDSCR